MITNVEYDHPDLFPTRLDYRQAFDAFVDLVQDRLIVCREDPVAAGLGRAGLARETYGLSAEADWRAEEIRPNAAGGSDFLAFHAGKSLGLMRTRLPGRHNVLNALAAMAAVVRFGVAPADLRQALTEFRGVQRRFTIAGEAGEVTVIDDYAHHPSEVQATLEAVRGRYPGREVWAVFQPHTYSRLRALAPDFAHAFDGADHVVVTGVFASREQPVVGIDAKWLAGQLDHDDVHPAEALEEAAQVVLARLAAAGGRRDAERRGREPRG